MAAKAKREYRVEQSVREVVEDRVRDRSYSAGALESLQYTVDNITRAIGILAQVLVDHDILSAEDIGEIIEGTVTITK